LQVLRISAFPGVEYFGPPSFQIPGVTDDHGEMMGDGRCRDQAVHHREFFAPSFSSAQEPSPGPGHFPIDGQKPPFKPRHEIILSLLGGTGGVQEQKAWPSVPGGQQPHGFLTFFANQWVQAAGEGIPDDLEVSLRLAVSLKDSGLHDRNKNAHGRAGGEGDRHLIHRAPPKVTGL
jgi:hypothetical protein